MFSLLIHIAHWFGWLLAFIILSQCCELHVKLISFDNSHSLKKLLVLVF